MEVNFESFYGDFSHAFAPINEGFSLQELSDIDIAASGLSPDSSIRMSFVAVCPFHPSSYITPWTDEC